jgi:Raf kinase inhibitor-like YbhB/YbcL family protein
VVGPYTVLALLLALAGAVRTADPAGAPGRAALHAGTPIEPGEVVAEDAMKLDVTSSAFREGDSIPPRYTCDGENVSPPLAWSGVPETTVTLAVIADDPDAPHGTWVHWVLYSIEPTLRDLAEGVPARESVLEGALQGRNDFKEIGYGGPCPPGGQRHRYFFRVYALDARLDLGAGATKAELLEAMAGHVVAEGTLMGTYRRS